MCNVACIQFGMNNISPTDIKNKRVLEIGSLDFNGSLREYILSLEPSEYIGTDIVSGKGVDVICRAEDLLGIYGPESFDLIISTEAIEHIFDWRSTINNIKSLCKLNGSILITTRSYGFPLHGWPHDHWRFETYDLKYIFSDFTKVMVQKDPDFGSFIKARKPDKYIDYRQINLSDYYLYNIIYDLRIR